jgi:hypothetical protein
MPATLIRKSWMCQDGRFLTSMQVLRMLVCQYACLAVKER